MKIILIFFKFISPQTLSKNQKPKYKIGTVNHLPLQPISFYSSFLLTLPKLNSKNKNYNCTQKISIHSPHHSLFQNSDKPTYHPSFYSLQRRFNKFLSKPPFQSIQQQPLSALAKSSSREAIRGKEVNGK